jgi:hypothetical protein
MFTLHITKQYCYNFGGGKDLPDEFWHAQEWLPVSHDWKGNLTQHDKLLMDHVALHKQLRMTFCHASTSPLIYSQSPISTMSRP